MTVALVMARRRVSRTGEVRWQVRFDYGSDLTIAIWIDDDNPTVRDD